MSASLSGSVDSDGTSDHDANSSISEASDDDEFYDSDIDLFGTVAAGGSDLDISDHVPIDQTTPSNPPEVCTSPPKSPNSPDDDDEILMPSLPSLDVDNQPISAKPDKPPPGKSIAHWDLEAGDIVLCSFDLESGGEQCGIVQVQMSAQLWRPNPVDVTGRDGLLRRRHLTPMFVASLMA